MTGIFARSKSGHDKDKVYIIVKEDKDFVYLCNGVNRLIECPKKKKSKHIQPIINIRPQGFETDDIIKKEIEHYLRQED